MEYVPKVVFIDKPFKVDALPLKDIYVLDNWLCSELQQHYDEQLRFTNFWAKANEVRNHNSTTGLPHHSFWGGSMFRLQNYEVDDDVNPLDTKFTKYLNRRLQTEFGFKWVRFQYAGLNSQTQGLHGTTHADCAEEDEWNLSFLYYPNTFWNPKWGGALRIYDSPQQGLDGRDEHIKNHQVAEIEFKPNRLIMFDGRIPHGADAPTPSARYMDRRSLVLRGDEVRLTHTEENYDANDRLSYL